MPRPLREAVGTIDALGSNVYSRCERVLLAWLNHHWREQRAAVFGDQGEGERERSHCSLETRSYSKVTRQTLGD